MLMRDYSITTAHIKIRIAFNGNRIGEPEIIKVLPENPEVNLSKLARIYARMIQNDLANSEGEGGQKKLEVQKSERKSC